MNQFLFSSTLWRNQREDVLTLIGHFNQKHKDEFVMAIKPIEIVEKSDLYDFKYEAISLTDFIDMGTSSDGILDIHKVRNFPFLVPSEHVIVVDASGFRQNIIDSFLAQCRFGWYELNEWHPAFVFIVDESYVLSSAKGLASTFYLQPEFLSETDLRVRTRVLIRAGKIMHYFGHKHSKKVQWIISIFDYIGRFKVKKEKDRKEL